MQGEGAAEPIPYVQHTLHSLPLPTVELYGSQTKINQHTLTALNSINHHHTPAHRQPAPAHTPIIASILQHTPAWVDVAGVMSLVRRSGYTGEDGFELYLMDEPMANPKRAEKIWDAMLEAGEDLGIKPCGLGARDTTRLEAGLCLYGNELTEDISPLEARIKYAVRLDKGTS